jgi:hypothetical protein
MSLNLVLITELRITTQVYQAKGLPKSQPFCALKNHFQP